MALPQIDALLEEGRLSEAAGALEALTRGGAAAHTLAEAGQRFTQLNLHPEAERCYRHAARLEPQSAPHLYNWATSLIALGRLDEAENALSRVIALNPADFDAYYNRATLRRQTPSRNHVAELTAALERPIRHPGGVVALCYALAKELEDLGEYARSFACLKRGADTRRHMLSYRVEDDEATMQHLARVFDAGYFARAGEGCADGRPLFIIGLPRSGTTLVDRILSSHSMIMSRGETNDVAKALLRELGPAHSKAELIERSAQVDFHDLGTSYVRRLPAGDYQRAIDKNPINFLYLGVIARALPQARIVHVRRGVMDVCYAMYKTLFRMAYPFSYDLSDIARYYHAYARLMGHWRAMMPTRYLEVRYEDLIEHPAEISRQLIDFCGLSWEDACLSFERNEAPCLTASAAQVRQPLYRSSMGKWRHYQDALAPLAATLGELGIEVE